jgi:hypothetical protein
MMLHLNLGKGCQLGNRGHFCFERRPRVPAYIGAYNVLQKEKKKGFNQSVDHLQHYR